MTTSGSTAACRFAIALLELDFARVSAGADGGRFVVNFVAACGVSIFGVGSLSLGADVPRC